MEGFRESRRCSRHTYPESCVTEYILIYEDHKVKVFAGGLAGRVLLGAVGGGCAMKFATQNDLS
jgi:hypothetical protein